MPGVALHVSMGMLLQLFQHISLWMMTVTGSEHVIVLFVCVFHDYSFTTEPCSVCLEYMWQCALSSEKCVTACDGDISQLLNTSEYTVYNIYGFPYFFKIRIHIMGSLCTNLIVSSVCVCVCVCVCVHACVCVCVCVCVQIRLHEIHFIDAWRHP